MDKIFKHIKPKRVLDVGAHIGSFTQLLLERIPDCQILMVEPNPNCEPFLKKIGHPYDMVALGKSNGIAEIHVEVANPIGTGASLYKENTIWYEGDKSRKVTVPMKSLDSCNYFDKQQIDLIKLDVQGSELDVISGGEETVKKASFLLAEVSLIPYNQGSPMIEEVVEKLSTLNFDIVDIIEYHKIEKDIYFQLDLLFKNSRYKTTTL